MANSVCTLYRPVFFRLIKTVSIIFYSFCVYLLGIIATYIVHANGETIKRASHSRFHYPFVAKCNCCSLRNCIGINEIYAIGFCFFSFFSLLLLRSIHSSLISSTDLYLKRCALQLHMRPPSATHQINVRQQCQCEICKRKRRKENHIHLMVSSICDAYLWDHFIACDARMCFRLVSISNSSNHMPLLISIEYVL